MLYSDLMIDMTKRKEGEKVSEFEFKWLQYKAVKLKKTLVRTINEHCTSGLPAI